MTYLQELIRVLEILKKKLNKELEISNRQAQKKPGRLTSSNELAAVNVLQLDQLELLEKKKMEAERRYPKVAAVLSAAQTWGTFDFARQVLSSLSKRAGFDADERLNSLQAACSGIEEHKQNISASGMLPRLMTRQELDAVSSQLNLACDQRNRTISDARKAVTRFNKLCSEFEGALDAACDLRATSGPGKVALDDNYARLIRPLEQTLKLRNFEEALELLKSVPLRLQPTLEGKAAFKTIAENVINKWKDPIPLALFAEETRNQEVVETALAIVQPFLRAGWTSTEIDCLFTNLSQIGSLQQDVNGALYWIGSSAEESVLGSVLGVELESDYNDGIIAALGKQASSIGRDLFRHLGYSAAFPFEIATFSTDQYGSEADVGADLGIILYMTLEDGTTLIRGALLQGKRAVGTQANLYRESSRLGKNHQIIALTSAAVIGYYAFYHSPADKVGISILDARTARSEILKSQPSGTKLSDCTKQQCVVSTVAGTHDFATFFAFTLMNEIHAFNTLKDAMSEMGKRRFGFAVEEGMDKTYRLAGRLTLVAVGGPLPELEESFLRDLGFEESRERARYKAGLGPRS